MGMHDTEAFEDQRWRTFTQSLEFRHTAALALVQEGPILDIGCGDGLELSLLKDAGYSAEGIDVSEEAVLRCRERGLVANVYDPSKPLPFETDSVSTILLLDVLEHVFDPGSLLAEAARISKKDVIVSVPNFSSIPARIQVALGKVPENNRPGKGHIYWFTKHELDACAARADLVCAELRMNTFSPLSKIGVSPTIWPSALALSFVARFTKRQGNPEMV